MLDVHGVCKVTFERVDIRSADESVVADHACDSAVDLAFDGLVLQLQVGERNGHRSSSTPAIVVDTAHFRGGNRRAGLPA